MSEATQIVHWPGKDVAACDDHAAQLKTVAGHMGFQVSSTPCEPTVCANCQNAAEKAVSK